MAARNPVARTCHKCHKRCIRGCKILTSPSKLAKIAFEFLDRWVTRRTIVTFAMLEAVASIGAVLFFWSVRDISDLGFFIHSWFFFPFVMFIRTLSSGLGFVAGFFRKVKLTKFYFALLSFNIPMTFLVCVPLWRCSCTCDRHEFLSLRKDNKLKDPDCRVLQQFASSLQTQASRRLLPAESDGEPATRSHALAVAKAVADTVGTASTNSSMLRDWQTAAMRALFNIRYFFSLASTPPPSPSSPRLSGLRRNMLRNRILANSHQRRRSGTAVTNISRGNASSVFRRLIATKPQNRGPKLQYPILYYFDVTEAGIGWRAQSDTTDEWMKENCDADGTDLSSEKIRTLMEDALRKWTFDDDKQGTTFKKTCENKHHWCEMLTAALSRCVKDEQCGAVQGRSLIEKVFKSHDFDGIEQWEDASRFRVCRYPLPIYPRLLKGDENQTGNIYFQKKETVTIKAMMLNQFEEDSAADKCYAIVTLVMMSLLFLDMISVPMFIIVQKFLMRRCGDFLCRERQFSVQFSSEEEDSEDDFTISSGTWMGGSPSRHMSGVTSSFQSMREGEGNFSPAKSPSKAPRKVTMPEHWKGGPASISGVELTDAVSNKSAESEGKREKSVYLQMDHTMTLDETPPAHAQGGASPSKKKAGQAPPSTYSWG